MIKKVIAAALLTLSVSLPASDEGLAILYNGKEYRLQDLPPALQDVYATARDKASEALTPSETKAIFEDYISKIANASHRTIDDVRDELQQATPAVKEKVAEYYEQLKEKATDLKSQAEDTETGEAALNWYEKAKEKAKSLIESAN
ncbi:hypothetical protein EOPP23_00195 [Endozoicomonas sp. OPT23]|uniref:hypothetical protein n=1 Tax=Endozoicomonas sp. OPT23 TaxID=2072845 RepID=UPI00129BC9D4|nr:hypothetical protein [Endozoicomonas sp. OPT23]MRI31408.1 hypothetical protein [Endozoicomonas sp. OPT23]